MNLERLKVTVRGVVQGVGFRPFVYRLASELGLRGWVLNSAQGVFIEVEGDRQSLENFLPRLNWLSTVPDSPLQSGRAHDGSGYAGHRYLCGLSRGNSRTREPPLP